MSIRLIKNLFIALVALMIAFALSGCGQFTAKNFGGDYTINLPAGEKLVNITWKESELWYLTKPMTEDDVAETYKFQEDSTFGVLEGTVTIIEHKE